MRSTLSSWITKSAVFLGISLAASGVAFGQAVVTADRGAAIAPFVTSTLVHPDWGQLNNTGFTVGVDYTRFTPTLIQPSLELRMTHGNGTQVGENTWLTGFKLETAISRIHPYATLLAGMGYIAFKNQPGYPSDSSFVYSIGGGAEFNVTQSWKVRADFTEQHWNLDPVILTPMNFGIGISYSIPFHKSGGWVH
jgi:opacity protein-like surface antigen